MRPPVFATIGSVEAYVTRHRTFDALLASAMRNAKELKNQTDGWGYSEDWLRIKDIRDRNARRADEAAKELNRRTTWWERFAHKDKRVGEFTQEGVRFR